MAESNEPAPGPPPPDPDQTPQRLYFHVGFPKSGSTYLQTVLGNNRAALRRAGHVYPYVRQEGMFHAAVEMAGDPDRWGLDPEVISGTFAHLLRRARRLGGTVIISHEIFGSATEKQIARMAPLLDGFEVHVVVTVRDLGRTATAEWQEQVKNGNPRSFAAFVDALMSHLPDEGGDGTPFWRSQNLHDLLRRWQALVPPERTHVVTCPPSGAAPDLLWRRFAEAVELSPDAVDLTRIPRRNESLGTAQIAFLRRVVEALDGRLEQPWFSRVAKRWFAQTLLSRLSTSAKPVTPAPVARRLAAVSAAWIEEVRAGGYQVHGELDELLPQVVEEHAPHPDDATEAEILEGLPDVVAEMLLRTGRMQAELAQVRADNDALERTCEELGTQLLQLDAELEGRTGRRHRWLPFRVVRARAPRPENTAERT